MTFPELARQFACVLTIAAWMALPLAGGIAMTLFALVIGLHQ